MRKTITSIIAASAVYLAACATPQPEPQTAPVSIAPVTSLHALANEVYAPAARAPNGTYTLRIEGMLVGVKSKKVPVQGDIRSGDMEVTSDGVTSQLFSDYGQDGEINQYFTGRSVEGFVFYDKQSQAEHQQEYVDLLLKVKAALDATR